MKETLRSKGRSQWQPYDDEPEPVVLPSVPDVSDAARAFREAKDAARRNARVNSGDARRRSRPPTRHELPPQPFSRADSGVDDLGGQLDFAQAARQAYLESRMAARRNANQAAVGMRILWKEGDWRGGGGQLKKKDCV